MWKWSRLLGAACSQARPPASTARFLSSAVATRPPFVLPRRGDELLLGCVSYDPAVGEIWQRMKDYFCGAGVPFDFLLFSNYEQLVRALLDQTIDVAWNGPIAHVMAHDQGIVTSLGMRDCDRDFSSLLVVPRAVAEAGLERVEQLEGWEVVTGASDSPQAHVVPLYWLEVEKGVRLGSVRAHDADLGKHGDTAVGEVRVLEEMAAGARVAGVVSRMMWDRALGGALATVDATRLAARAVELAGPHNRIPPFDHCQFDALAHQPGGKQVHIDAFVRALRGMCWNNPAHQEVMRLEGLRKEWVGPREEGYAIVRKAYRHALTRAGGQAGGPQGRRCLSTCASSTHSGRAGARRLRVGVVGAGVAGLQVVRACQRRGLDVAAYHADSLPGGVWAHNYAGYGLQVPPTLYEFPGFPFPGRRSGRVPTGPEVQRYIMGYVGHHQLEPHLHANARVTGIKPQAGGVWEMRVACTRTGREEKKEVDAVVVATGMYSNPYLPDLAALQRPHFPGRVIHSSEFTDSAAATGRRVVVVGGGKSAYDVALEAGRAGATSTILIQRVPHWQAPRDILGVLPMQYVFFSRFGQALYNAHRGTLPDEVAGSRGCTSLAGPVFAAVEALVAAQLGTTGELRPTTDILDDLHGYAAIQDTSVKRARASGALSVVNGMVAKLSAAGHVELEGGATHPADLVIFATGFTKDYSLLSTEVRSALDLGDDGLWLYRHMLPPGIPGLVFVGSEIASSSNILTHGLQAEWVARYLTGAVPQKSVEVMKREVEAIKEWKRSWMPATASRAAMVLLYQLAYHDRLMKDMGERHLRKANPFAELFMPYTSQDYAGVFS